MKKIIITLTIPLLLLLSCDGMSIGSGTLGASATFHLSCSEEESFEYMEMVTKTEKFAVPEELEDLVNFWERNGYDFLTYWIYKYNNSLYCVTHSKHDNAFSIRAVCHIEKKEWIVALDFSDLEHNDAKESLEMLLLGLHCVIR